MAGFRRGKISTRPIQKSEFQFLGVLADALWRPTPGRSSRLFAAGQGAPPRGASRNHDLLAALDQIEELTKLFAGSQAPTSRLVRALGIEPA